MGPVAEPMQGMPRAPGVARSSTRVVRASAGRRFPTHYAIRKVRINVDSSPQSSHL